MVPIDEVFHFDVITSTPTTGAVADADSTPTFAVYEEATDTDIGVGGNLTKRTSLTGNYRGSFTCSAANGFEAGKWYSVIASATVNSVAGKAVAATFRVAPAETAAGVPKVDASHIEGADATDTLDARSQVGAAAALTAYDPPTRTEATSDKDAIITAVGNVETDTQDLQTQIGAAGAGLTSIPNSAGVSTLLTRASEARLAELDAANLPTDIDAILADTGTDGVVVAAGSKSGYSLTTAPPTAAAIADQVWDEATADHATAGSTGAALTSATAPSAATVADAVWDELLSGHAISGSAGAALTSASTGGSVTVSYSQVTAILAAAEEAGTITLYTTYNSVTLLGIGSLTGRTKLYVTVKSSREQADTAAILQWEESAGLVYLNGAAATASEGALTVNDAATGSITFTLKSASGVQLSPGTYEYDVSMITSASNVAAIKAQGKLLVRRTVTRAIT